LFIAKRFVGLTDVRDQLGREERLPLRFHIWLIAKRPHTESTHDKATDIAMRGPRTSMCALVICGPLERDASKSTHVTNPRLIVEVLSRATAEYDRGDKLEHYRQIPSFETVVIIDHEAPGIELWTREANGWTSRHFAPGDTHQRKHPPAKRMQRGKRLANSSCGNIAPSHGSAQCRLSLLERAVSRLEPQPSVPRFQRARDPPRPKGAGKT